MSKPRGGVDGEGLLCAPLPAGACGVLVCPSGHINVCGPPLDGEGLADEASGRLEQDVRF